MIPLRDIARAKLNLTLEVLGRRSDGYHELRSLVAFAALGDDLELELGAPLGLETQGRFADKLSGDNLIIRAAEAAFASTAGVKLGRFRLIKQLPVAAGLGGGSADAAAALRLIARANPGRLSEAAMASIAARLGSDVTVCLASRPALMTGRGESVEPVQGLPPCGVLLANPGVQLPAAAVYAELRAEDLRASPLVAQGAPDFHGDFEQLIAYALPRLNDLEAPAARLVPEIREVLAALLALDGPHLVRLSGSGPTCFALFASEEDAKREGARLRDEFPNWWIEASSLGS
jgi:4-diphosphocytidyl-2-C-methyl-D-erythritol kinase